MYQLGLIGYPIKHSLSPWIHEQFLKNANLNGSYSIIEINPNQSFEKEINQLKEQKFDGFNVTVPYKQTIIPYLDALDTEAKEIGAVNTVVNREGKWIGYNTDGKGYLRSLESHFPDLLLNEKKVLILGAGGAARGIYYALVDAGMNKVDIANRTSDRAAKISALKKPTTDTSLLSLKEAEQTIATYDVIVQTTSVGMSPSNDVSIISLDQLKPTSIVSDIVYQPIYTQFLQQAWDLGAKIHFGHTMLLYQAQYAFEIWTSNRVEVEINHMDDELRSILEGK